MLLLLGVEDEALIDHAGDHMVIGIAVFLGQAGLAHGRGWVGGWGRWQRKPDGGGGASNGFPVPLSIVSPFKHR